MRLPCRGGPAFIMSGWPHSPRHFASARMSRREVAGALVKLSASLEKHRRHGRRPGKSESGSGSARVRFSVKLSEATQRSPARGSARGVCKCEIIAKRLNVAKRLKVKAPEFAFFLSPANDGRERRGAVWKAAACCAGAARISNLCHARLRRHGPCLAKGRQSIFQILCPAFN